MSARDSRLPPFAGKRMDHPWSVTQSKVSVQQTDANLGQQAAGHPIRADALAGDGTDGPGRPRTAETPVATRLLRVKCRRG
jgi:hypothetical protein